MRVMLDTNVLISLFLFKGMKLENLFLRATLQHDLVSSSQIIAELFDVVERKFPGKTKYLEKFLDSMPYELALTQDYYPDHNLFSIRDEQDDTILFSAIAANVDVFITGDKDFLEVDIEKPEILTPREFMEKY